VKLQGVGPGGGSALGSVIDGRGVAGDTAYAEAWLIFLQSIPWSGNQAIYEGPVIYVLAQTNEFQSAYRPAIDGFSIQGGDQQGFPNLLNPIDPTVKDMAAVQGGGIFANAYARYLQITNNVLQSNGGAYAGAIRLGTPHLPGAFNDNQNDFVRIANNRIVANGGTNLAGAIGVFSGSEGYEIAGNDICGNFSAEYGGGISHYGLSPNGSIHDNRIYFNRAYDEAGGIMIAGELPADPAVLTPGAGAVDIYNNLIQANLSNDDGGGLRFLMSGNFVYNVYNNIIVNNISTHEGGGVSLNDAPQVRFFNNTVMKNLTTATAVTSNGDPAPAGLSTSLNSDLLQATLPVGSPLFSDPLLFNNLFWDNRAGTFVPASGVLGIGLTDTNGNPDPTPINYWDMGVSGNFGYLLSPTNSLLQNTFGTNPDGSNVVGAAPSILSEYSTSIAVLPWRGNPNFVDTLLVATELPIGLMGDYHLTSGSPAIDVGAASKNGINAPAFDFDRQGRPAGGVFDIGADEYPGPQADLSISKSNDRTYVIPGMTVTYNIVVTNLGPGNVTNAVVNDSLPGSLSNATWTCTATAGSSCTTASGTGNINNRLVSLLAGGSATFVLSARLSATPPGQNLSNTATVAAPGGTTDPVTGNNSSTDTDPINRTFPLADTVLDTFNRANTVNGLGPNWSGNTTSFHIVNNLAEVLSAGSVRWNAGFGANQEGFMSLNRIATGSNNDQALVLKYNGGANFNATASSWVMVSYRQSAGQVRISSKTAGASPVTLGNLSVSFNSGDRLGARVLDNGTVIVYRWTSGNGWTQIGSRQSTLTGGGQLGVNYGAQTGGAGNRARFNRFGGGNLP
jgi:uncharacterized repeat protein (TIGR01451 family)